MFHLIKYSIRVKLRNFETIFWPLVFPLLMATLFYFAFGRIEEADFETVRTAVVMEKDSSDKLQENLENMVKSEGEIFREFLTEIEESEEHLIQTEEMTEKEAEAALRRKDISGIFYTDGEIRLTVGANGIPESILQSLLESYENGKQTLLTVREARPKGMWAAMEQMSKYESLVEQVSLGGRTTNGNAQFFYALIAMACLYGTFIGLGSALWLQADLMPLAARRCATPTSKLALILSEMCSSFFLHFINVMILVLYIRYVLGQEFAGSLPEMMLVVLAGCIIGVSMGIFIGSISKFGEGVKVALMLGISMSCSFFAGLMNGDMKNVVEQHIPILNRLNPAAVVADAFYCINVYDDRSRYFRSLMILSVMAAVLLAASFVKIRRERYDSL
ncbi:ABC transporter permease [Mediterraneibacter agrestimuris]|uniref:ABC transporter permease n=1 Tax=Mediterraneibacter agrestimuris TaxID=2941333 RepID=UPI00203BC8EE|nr:ABC transporter permease [Mediterraneibacter agrestimuris]